MQDRALQDCVGKHIVGRFIENFHCDCVEINCSHVHGLSNLGMCRDAKIYYMIDYYWKLALVEYMCAWEVVKFRPSNSKSLVQSVMSASSRLALYNLTIFLCFTYPRRKSPRPSWRKLWLFWTRTSINWRTLEIRPKCYAIKDNGWTRISTCSWKTFSSKCKKFGKRQMLRTRPVLKIFGTRDRMKISC